MNAIEAIYTVKFNPFKYANYIYSFYNSLGIGKNSLLLSYVIIPICSHPTLSKKIENAKPKTSNLYTIFNNRNELYDLQERIEHLRELTNESLQYCIINDFIEIDFKDLSIYTHPINLNLEKVPKKLGGYLKGIL